MKLLEPSVPPKPDPESETYDEEYFRSSCGPDPYERNEVWLGFFSSIVEQVIRSLSPRKVLKCRVRPWYARGGVLGQGYPGQRYRCLDLRDR